ncbi:MAG TPA: hypothetical protein VN577_11525 [Terriglobales bacterium]|nr:hypothetical protein [Terriglobales bacterium]
MKAIGTTSTAILALLLGVAAPAYARQERSEARQQGEHQQAAQPHAQPQPSPTQKTKPATQAQQEHHPAQNQKQAHAQLQPNQNQKQAHAQPRPTPNQQHAPQQQSKAQPQHRQPQHIRQAAWQQHRAKSWQSDHRTWQQRGGYNGYRIPDDRFRGYFGPSHGFRIHGLPFQVVGGYPRFQYNGYWFSLVDPWPESWANDWYDTDDVYVNYVDNGYYLYDRRYPSTGIAINISF